MNVLKQNLINFKINLRLILGLLFITLCTIKTNKIYSQVGCMDNSKHTNLKLGYDYKVPYFVKCLHYRAPVQTIIVTKNLVNRKRY